MLIPTLNVVVLRCPTCGRLEFRGLSLFNFAGSRTWQAECSCGTTLLTISRKKGKNFWLQYHCGMCDCLHINRYTRQELWSRELLTLTCKETELEVGFIGPREKVQRAVQRHDRTLAEVAQDLGFDDYFEEPDVMYQLLSLIYQLAEDGRVSCGCGNENIEIEIFPGHLQLRCEACRAEKNLPAGTMADLERVENLQEIRLPGHLVSKNETSSKQRYRRRQKSPV
ncbi:Uncharacterized [Moorella glycerini]|uniref:Uncharacterized protein n=1 Tax=Neomoorella stamsii TaxID=1266720 RepID=A0A9X7J1T6_9FIRM|nr:MULTISPECIES: hypothetical protein [Moorella]PRR70037.1 hypothetical protein MOST_29140 [Moorella stamsii]CEP68412.1 Uncharacterized [Moorella glycerini]